MSPAPLRQTVDSVRQGCRQAPAGDVTFTITDFHIRPFHQVQDLMEFIETVVKHKAEEGQLAVHLVTTLDEFKGEQQQENLEKIQTAAATAGITFTWEFDTTGTIHARHIVTDTGWKILLDRGLDIFQRYEMSEAFAFANRLQQYRAVKAFEVTYIVNTPPAKAGGFGLRLKAGSVGHSADCCRYTT